MLDSGASPGLPAEAGSPFFVLSDRQCEVLRLAAAGLCDSEIALALVLSVHTVRDHLKAIRARMGARNTTHAVSIALGQGIISLEALTATLAAYKGWSGQCPGEDGG
jgi:DNA-binding NarL/FixJ family response regulator